MTPWTIAHQAPLSMGFCSKNTGMSCHFLQKGFFQSQGSNLSLLLLCHWQADSLPLSHLGSPDQVCMCYLFRNCKPEKGVDRSLCRRLWGWATLRNSSGIHRRVGGGDRARRDSSSLLHHCRLCLHLLRAPLSSSGSGERLPHSHGGLCLLDPKSDRVPAAPPPHVPTSSRDFQNHCLLLSFSCEAPGRGQYLQTQGREGMAAATGVRLWGDKAFSRARPHVSSRACGGSSSPASPRLPSQPQVLVMCTRLGYTP